MCRTNLVATYNYQNGVKQNIDDSDANAFRYCGAYYDKETVTIYLRARCYNPYNGRFVSRDSFASSNNDPLSLNLCISIATTTLFLEQTALVIYCMQFTCKH